MCVDMYLWDLRKEKKIDAEWKKLDVISSESFPDQLMHMPVHQQEDNLIVLESWYLKINTKL